MPEIKTLPLPTPDFDLNRENLKQFMKEHPQFKDYDFDGSNLAHLLDVLALNTYNNAFFLNQVGNESNLTTAFRRDSVANRSLDLGYVATNTRSASVGIRMELFPTADVPKIDIEKGLVFSGLNTEFKFVTTEPYTVFKNNNSYIIDVIAYEGKLLTHRYNFSSESNSSGLFIIPNVNVDESKVRVYVKNTVNGNQEEYTRSDKILSVDQQSKVYFLKYRDGLYFVEFGDNVIGYRPTENSEINIEYLVSQGSAANNVKSFGLVGGVSGVASITITPTSASTGGKEPETIQQIKSNATKSFRSQNLAIVPEDYEIIAKRELSIVGDCIAYGGEEADPKRYGAVFIVPAPRTGLLFSSDQKSLIKRTLQKYAVTGTNIIVSDPDYLFIHVSTIVSYDKNKLVGTEADLMASIRSSIEQYYEDNLMGRHREFNRSVISRFIDYSADSVLSNKLGYYMEKRRTINTSAPNNIIINFPVAGCSLETSSFSTDGQNTVLMKSNTNGGIDIVDLSGNIVRASVGTFDGSRVQLDSLIVLSTSSQDQTTGLPNISFTLTTAEQDILNDSTAFTRIIIDSISVVGE